MLIKPFSDHSCPVDGGITVVTKIMAFPSIFIHDPKHDGMLVAKLSHEPHLCGSTCFQYTLNP